MNWTKIGQIFCATGQSDLMMAGARAPVPLHLQDSFYRIYFASYDSDGRGRIFSLEIDIEKPDTVLNITADPVIDIGQTGFFDDNGIIPSDLLVVGDSIYLYTIGFSVKNKLIFDAASGLAISRDGGFNFSKLNGPIIDRGVDDPCFAASPTVIRGAEEWRMWYVSCDHWKPHDGGFRHFYNIKHRRSQDGIYWEPRADICIDYASEYEYAISRPSVIHDHQGKYNMWYSFRAQPGIDTYRIGYAQSDDGLSWRRMDDKAGIDVSASGWDAEMICYPKVFIHKEKYYMLYNGNGYGKTGFGLAVLEDKE